MLVKPKPWVNPNNGGYIYSKNNAMRFKESVEQETYLQRASELGQVELVYAGLDVLGSTPWKINEKVCWTPLRGSRFPHMRLGF